MTTPDIDSRDPVTDLWGGLRRGQVSTRVINTFRRNGIDTVGCLAEHSADSLRDLRSFRDGSLAEVRRVLAEHGLALAGETAEVTP